MKLFIISVRHCCCSSSPFFPPQSTFQNNLCYQNIFVLQHSNSRVELKCWKDLVTAHPHSSQTSLNWLHLSHTLKVKWLFSLYGDLFTFSKSKREQIFYLKDGQMRDQSTSKCFFSTFFTLASMRISMYFSIWTFSLLHFTGRKVHRSSYVLNWDSGCPQLM